MRTRPERPREVPVSDEIRLSLPAQPEYARLARLAAASIAARMGFTYDELEDVRMAVGEAWSLLQPDELVDVDPAGTIEVLIVLGPDALDITLRGHGLPQGGDGGVRAGQVPDLSRQVLAAMVDEADVEADEIRLRKARTDSAR